MNPYPYPANYPISQSHRELMRERVLRKPRMNFSPKNVKSFKLLHKFFLVKQWCNINNPARGYVVGFYAMARIILSVDFVCSLFYADSRCLPIQVETQSSNSCLNLSKVRQCCFRTNIFRQACWFR